MDENLQEVLMPISIIGTIAFGIITLVRTLTEYYLRKRLIEKGMVGVDSAEILKKQETSPYPALKWGLVTLSGGLGLILLEMIPYEYQSPLPYGILASTLSGGFLAYFILTQTIFKQK